MLHLLRIFFRLGLALGSTLIHFGQADVVWAGPQARPVEALRYPSWHSLEESSGERREPGSTSAAPREASATSGAVLVMPAASSPAPSVPRLGPPPRAIEGDAPPPSLLGSPYARRSWLFGVEGQLLHQLCPEWAEVCRNGVGLGATAFAQSRSAPWFSWGPVLTWSDRQEDLQLQGARSQQRSRAGGALLAGRVWLVDTGPFDPYLQVATGLGQVTTERRISAPEALAVTNRETRLTPVYAASFGVDAHVSQALRVGAVFTWTHWLNAPQERCPVVLGVCSFPSPGQFDPANAVWTLGLAVSSSFGQLL